MQAASGAIHAQGSEAVLLSAQAQAQAQLHAASAALAAVAQADWLRAHVQTEGCAACLAREDNDPAWPLFTAGVFLWVNLKKWSSSQRASPRWYRYRILTRNQSGASADACTVLMLTAHLELGQVQWRHAPSALRCVQCKVEHARARPRVRVPRRTFQGRQWRAQHDGVCLAARTEAHAATWGARVLKSAQPRGNAPSC